MSPKSLVLFYKIFFRSLHKKKITVLKIESSRFNQMQGLYLIYMIYYTYLSGDHKLPVTFGRKV